MGNEVFLPAIRSSNNDSDLRELDKYEEAMVRVLDVANNIEVVDTDSKQKAADALDYISALLATIEAIVERFRKPAHTYYQEVLAQKKALVNPPKDVIALLKLKIKEYDDECERKLAEAKLEYLMGEAEDEGEALHRATEAVEAKVVGLTTRTYWKAECVDMKALCRAIADGVAPVELVEYNTSAGNSLAAKLRKAMQYPGIRVYKDKVPVRSRR